MSSAGGGVVSSGGCVSSSSGGGTVSSGGGAVSSGGAASSSAGGGASPAGPHWLPTRTVPSGHASSHPPSCSTRPEQSLRSARRSRIRPGKPRCPAHTPDLDPAPASRVGGRILIFGGRALLGWWRFLGWRRLIIRWRGLTILGRRCPFVFRWRLFLGRRTLIVLRNQAFRGDGTPIVRACILRAVRRESLLARRLITIARSQIAAVHAHRDGIFGGPRAGHAHVPDLMRTLTFGKTPATAEPNVPLRARGLALAITADKLIARTGIAALAIRTARLPPRARRLTDAIDFLGSGAALIAALSALRGVRHHLVRGALIFAVG